MTACGHFMLMLCCTKPMPKLYAATEKGSLGSVICAFTDLQHASCEGRVIMRMNYSWTGMADRNTPRENHSTFLQSRAHKCFDRLLGDDSRRLSVFDLGFLHLFRCVGDGVFLLLALALRIDIDIGADIFLSDFSGLQLVCAAVVGGGGGGGFVGFFLEAGDFGFCFVDVLLWISMD